MLVKCSGKKIISHGGIYLIGSILQRSVSFIMLPIYTRCLTPADYGTIELLSMAIDFVGIIFGLRVSQSIFRYYYKYEGVKRNAVISTSLYLVLFANIVGALTVIIFSEPLSFALFGEHGQSLRLSLFAITMLGQGATEIPMIGIRASQRPILFVSVSIVKLLIQLSLNIYFVVLKGLSVDGVIYSALISTIISGFCLSGYTAFVRGVSFSKSQAKKLVSFSLPLVMSDVVGFYVTFGDRYFLRIFCSLTEVGIYSLGYKFGFLLSFIVTQPFNSVWDTEKYEIALKENYKEQYRRIFVIFSFILIFVCLVISVFSKDFFKIMADHAFLEAYKVVPIMLAAYLMNAWCSFVNLSVLIKQKTIEVFYGTVIASLVSTAGYFLFVPAMGAIGAAITALGAFGSRLIWVYYRGRNLFDLGIKWQDVVPLLILWAVAVFFGRYSPINIYMSILYEILIVILAGLTVYCFPIISNDIKKIILEFCKERFGFLIKK